VRALLQNGTIGPVHAIDLEYQLNTSHGADYFRRWHAHKECSGGLLVHKSTHHFDLVNWCIDGIPQDVFAWGSLKFYGRENALRRGDEKYTEYDRYTDEPRAAGDPFAYRIEHESERALYKNAEQESGYLRDRNVFREGISIEDTMAVLVKYRDGAVLNYSLVAYSPQEGFRVTFTGDKGRIEYTERHKTHIIRGQSDTELAAEQAQGDGHGMELRVIPMFSAGYEVPIETAAGGHGGGDPLIQRQIFDPNAPEELFGRNAGHEQGAASILIGVAANRSMESGLPVAINDLCEVRPDAVKLHELV
jgi:predicted dehydrogenase